MRRPARSAEAFTNISTTIDVLAGVAQGDPPKLLMLVTRRSGGPLQTLTLYFTFRIRS